MQTVLALLLGAVAGAMGNRIRGGFLTDRWPVGGQLQRLVYSALLTAVMVASGWPWPVDGWRLALLVVTFIAAWFLGAIALGTLSSIDSGRREGTRLRDGFLNAVRGLVYVLLPAVVLAVFRAVHGDKHGAWAAGLLLLGGACQGWCYELAHTLWPMSQGRKPTEAAELLTGACFGLGAVGAALV